MIAFTRPILLFEIKHDNGTIMGILSHLLDKCEPYIDWYIIYRH